MSKYFWILTARYGFMSISIFWPKMTFFSCKIGKYSTNLVLGSWKFMIYVKSPNAIFFYPNDSLVSNFWPIKGQGCDIQNPFSKTICQARFFNDFQAGGCLLTQKMISEKSRPGCLKLGSQGQKPVLAGLYTDNKGTKPSKQPIKAYKIVF